MTKLAIQGGTPIRTKPFPAWPVHDEREVEAVTRVVRSGNWGRLAGVEAPLLEKEFAQAHDANYALAVTNGTTALEVALGALGVGAGDEVIVPAYTFVASATCVLTANAIPVFADVDPDTFNINFDSVRSKITSRTKAIIPVHFAGLPVNMDELMALASEYGLHVLEDSAHAHGAKFRGKGAGSFGAFGSFSFQSSKNMNSGEGGILLTNDEELYELANSLHSFGRLPGRPWYEHHIYRGTLRITELQSAILRVQLSRLEEQNKIRRNNAALLTEMLSEIPGITCIDPAGDDAKGRVYHIYVFRYSPEQFGGLNKEKFIEALIAEGVPAAGGYPVPLYKQNLFMTKSAKAKGCPFACPMYDGPEVDYAQMHLPGAEKACNEAVWLTQNLLLGEEQDMRDIVEAVQKIQANATQLVKG